MSSSKKPVVVDPEILADTPPLTPEEDARLLSESTTLKSIANTHFTSGNYLLALETYQTALARLPATSHPKEEAIIHSNIAAASLKTGDYQAAIVASNAALKILEPLIKSEEERLQQEKEKEKQDEKNDSDSDSDIEEIISDGAKKAASTPQKQPPPPPLNPLTSLHTLHTKTLLRHAHAHLNPPPTWSHLTTAQTTLQKLSHSPHTARLGAADRRWVQRELAGLPGRIKKAQEAELADMWGKLKGLGDGLLKPFGLSTENFRMVEQEGGGYSMSFTQNPGSK